MTHFFLKKVNKTVEQALYDKRKPFLASDDALEWPSRFG